MLFKNNIPKDWSSIKIILFPNPILRNKSTDVPKDYPIHDLIETMIDILELIPDGVGISSPQIGINLNAFIGFADQVFINPKIIDSRGSTNRYYEGCLSIPGVNGYVERHQKIKISWFDENWRAHTKLFKGFEAVVIQHEMDHLSGVLFLDKTDFNKIDGTGDLSRLEKSDVTLSAEINYPHIIYTPK